MIGTSVYLSSFNYEELEKYARQGIKDVFTSLHIPEEEINSEQIQKLISTAQRHEMNLIVDVSPQTLKILEIESVVELVNYGIKSIRLDYGFDDLNYIKTLTEQFTIVLNASIINADYIKKLVNNGIQINKIKALHNFYPKINSGLDMKNFVVKNRELKNMGIEVYAFVAGDLEYRLPTFDGLVTLEKHRGISSYVAGIELLTMCYVDGVFIGDGRISEKNLKKLIAFDKDRSTVEIRTILDDKYVNMYDKEYKKRKDSNSRVIRLLTRAEEDVPQYNCLKRYRGAISVTNNNYGRYKNEIELCNTDLGFDNRFNVMGYLYQEDYEILEMLENIETIIFRRV